MLNKKVFFYTIGLPEQFNFSNILMDCDFFKPVNIGFKSVEMSFVNRNASEKIITGLFVSTQIKDVPPTHIPGNDDYSAIKLLDGEGLAYPSAFLFCEKANVLLIEYNKAGVNTGNLKDFFMKNALRKEIEAFDIQLLPVLSYDSYTGVNGMDLITEIELQVAQPMAIDRMSEKIGPIGEYTHMASSIGASKSLSLVFKADFRHGDGLLKRKVLEIVRYFGGEEMVQGKGKGLGRLKNQLKIKGYKNNDDGTAVEELINVVMNKLWGTFPIENTLLSDNPQFVERNKGIINVYKYYKQQLYDILVASE